MLSFEPRHIRSALCKAQRQSGHRWVRRMAGEALGRLQGSSRRCCSLFRLSSGAPGSAWRPQSNHHGLLLQRGPLKDRLVTFFCAALLTKACSKGFQVRPAVVLRARHGRRMDHYARGSATARGLQARRLAMPLLLGAFLSLAGLHNAAQDLESCQARCHARCSTVKSSHLG